MSKVKNPTIIYISSSSSDDDETNPPRLHFRTSTEALRKKAIKVENSKYTPDTQSSSDEDDCVILDFDPFADIDVLTKLSIKDHHEDDDDDQDLSVVAEIGQVACRDYPHSRHLCAKYPFNETLHETHCEQCYCYACDSPAPCKSWSSHSHANDRDPKWKDIRQIQCNLRS